MTLSITSMANEASFNPLLKLDTVPLIDLVDQKTAVVAMKVIVASVMPTEADVLDKQAKSLSKEDPLREAIFRGMLKKIPPSFRQDFIQTVERVIDPTGLKGQDRYEAISGLGRGYAAKREYDVTASDRELFMEESLTFAKNFDIEEAGYRASCSHP